MFDYEENKAVIKVVSVGAGGSNILNNLIEYKINDIEFIAMNTDPTILKLSKAPVKVRLGNMEYGTGSNPEIGREAALESNRDIREALIGSDLVVIVSCLGGGCSSGATPIIAGIAKESGARVMCIVTNPFHSEGKRRTEIATGGLQQLDAISEGLIVFPNDLILGCTPKPHEVMDSFKNGDVIFRDAIRGVTDLITMPSLKGINYADILSIVCGGNVIKVGFGSSTGENRASDSAIMAISSPLLSSMDISKAQGVLVSISASSNLTINEVDLINRLIHENVSDDANFILGVALDERLENEIKVTVYFCSTDVS